MSCPVNTEARRAIFAALEEADDELTPAEIARRAHRSQSATQMMLYALMEIGVVACRRTKRPYFYRLTGKPLPLPDRREEPQRVPDYRRYDHRPLARALGMPEQPPGIPVPSHVTVHPSR